MKKDLIKLLVSPSKIARTLNWKKGADASVLSLDIHKDRIGLAIAQHPSFQQKAKTLEPIQLQVEKDKGWSIPDSGKERFRQIVSDHQICGIVVSWPLQQDTGRMGAACGRVFHTLEDLIQIDDEDNATTDDTETSSSSSSPSSSSSLATMSPKSSLSRREIDNDEVFNKNRPICLWDGVHPQQEQQDEFGRCSAYSRTSNKTVHVASKEQYHQDENVVAAEVWADFVKTHWPTIYQQHQYESSSVPSSSSSSSSSTLVMRAA